MRYILILLACTNLLFAQEIKTNTYTVQPKETLYSISKKFNISIDEIKKSNSDIVDNSIKTGQVIVIPEKTTNQKKNSGSNDKVSHLVQSQETLYGIARKYNVAVSDLELENKELLKEGLRTGQKIVIPNKKKTIDGKPRIVNEQTTFHKIKKGETKYAVSKLYKISIEQLEKQNPEIVNRFTEGTIIAINKNGVVPKNTSDELMIALAEKEAALEKYKAQNAKIEDLEDKLIVQKQMNQKIIKLNSVDVDLKEIDNSNGSSVDKLKLILQSNKGMQDILISKLDSLVTDRYSDLEELKSSEIDDVEKYRKMQKESQLNRIETSKMIVQLKKDLNDSRKNYLDLMSKVQRINTLEDQEFKKRNRTVMELDAERKAELEQIRKIQALQDQNDVATESLFFKVETLQKQKEVEIVRRIEKATFYSASAREYDDRLALQKLIRYQNQIKKDKNIVDVEKEQPTVEEVRTKIKESNFTNSKIPAREIITNLKDVENGFYVVLKITQSPGERDDFARELADAGDLNTKFFYNINTFSYYVYTQKVKLFEEALLEVKTKENLPLYNEAMIVEVKLE